MLANWSRAKQRRIGAVLNRGIPISAFYIINHHMSPLIPSFNLGVHLYSCNLINYHMSPLIPSFNLGVYYIVAIRTMTVKLT